MGAVRVLVADDEPVIRSALEELLLGDPRLEFVGAAADAQEAIDMAAQLRPDVVLLDVRMPRGGGPRAAAEIDALPAGPSTVAFSAYDDRTAIVSMLDAGACGYLVKGAPNADIVATLLSAADRREERDAPAAGPGVTSLRLTVLIADELGTTRQGLEALIESRSEFELVGVAANGADALRLACIDRPRVVLIGRSLPGNSTAAIREIRQAVPQASVLAYTAEVDPGDVREAVEAGAMSYLVTGRGDEELIEAVREAASGRSTLSRGAASSVVRELSVAPVSAREHRRLWRRRAQIERFVRGDGVSVALQPIFDLHTGKTTIVEALARFNGGDGHGAAGPSLWFARAAEEGLGAELELAALRVALPALRRVPFTSRLAVNVSPQVAASAELAAELADVPGDRLILELTEHAAVADYAKLASAFRALRERGVELAVDDAGAGFSSLRHVLLIEPDYLKLDISLCAGIAKDRRRRALARALLSFAREIEVRTVAEGVETAEDLAALRELGVDLAQGFHLAPPSLPSH